MKTIKTLIILSLLAEALLASVCLFAKTITRIYVIRDPYPSKLVSLFNHKEKFFIRILIDKEKNYWYALHFTEPLESSGNTYKKICGVTGTANSAVYDIGTNTNNAIYRTVFSDFGRLEAPNE